MKKVLLAVFMALAPVSVMAQTKDVIVNDGEWRQNVSADPRQSGAVLKDKTMSLNTGAITYGIHVATAASADGKKVVPAEGYLGMPQPGSENWYGGGFMSISLNGNNIGSAPLKEMRVIETGERGAFDVIWDASEGAVRVRFLALPGDDRLFCEVALEPKTEVKSFDIRLSCYPSFFTSWHKQKGHRVVESPASKAEEGATFTIDPQKDWALLYYDTIFDVAAERGVGPCAMLFLPEQIKAGKSKIGDYCVPTESTVAPGVSAVRFIFWDLKGKTNKDAIATIKGKSAACRDELSKMSFVNRTLAGFDFAKKKAETDAAIASAKGTEPFAKKIGEIDAKLGPICEKVKTVVASGQAMPFALEDEALKLIAEREQVHWKLKFHVLLND